MDRIKVSIGIKDSGFSENIKGLSRYVEIVGVHPWKKEGQTLIK